MELLHITHRMHHFPMAIQSSTPCSSCIPDKASGRRLLRRQLQLKVVCRRSLACANNVANTDPHSTLLTPIHIIQPPGGSEATYPRTVQRLLQAKCCRPSLLFLTHHIMLLSVLRQKPSPLSSGLLLQPPRVGLT